MENPEEVSTAYGAVRVLIYCQDSFGLGHLRRNVNIAHEIHRLAPDAVASSDRSDPRAVLVERDELRSQLRNIIEPRDGRIRLLNHSQ